MPQHRGIISALRGRPEHERRVAGVTLYAILAAAIVLLWARSFPDLMALPGASSGEAGASGERSLLSPFASVREEFGQAASGFADLMRAIPAILGKTEELASRPAAPETESRNAISKGDSEPAATTMSPTAPSMNVVVPPEATGTPAPERIANIPVPGNSIAAETVLEAADTQAPLRLPALAPSASTAAALAAASQASIFDPLRDILFTIIRTR